jgi:signal transduction histidine kinase
MRIRSYPARLSARLPRRTVRLRLTALYGALFLASGTGLLAITNILARGWPWPPTITSPVGAHGLGHVVQGAARQVQAQVAHQVHAQVIRQDAAILNHLLVVSAIALTVMAVASLALGWLIAGRVLRPLRQMTTATRAISEDSLHRRLAVTGPGDELKDLGDTIDSLLERLEAAFDAQRNFVASASHELRTPLTLERAMLEIALASPDASAATLRAVCEDVLAVGQQQERLIDALLTLARSQRGLDHLAPADLADITRDILEAREPDAAARGLTVTASISPAPLLGDTRLLQRLAANLIDNAIRHNTTGGRISIQVTTSHDHPNLTITNTGPVIPPGQAIRLLQPFQRLSATRAAETEGLGLGLSIVAAIAKAHHATLAINSQPDGGLSINITFTPALPHGTGEKRTPQHDQTLRPAPSPTCHMPQVIRNCDQPEQPSALDARVRADR